MSLEELGNRFDDLVAAVERIALAVEGISYSLHKAQHEHPAPFVVRLHAAADAASKDLP